MEWILDIFLVSSLVLACIGTYKLVPPKYRIHANGLVVLLIGIVFFIVIENGIVQLFVLMLMIGDLIYFVFIGAYTACIDQVHDDGFTSDEFIKPFDLHIRQEDSTRDAGFWTKEQPQQAMPAEKGDQDA